MNKIRFTDTDELIDIRYDNVFKAVFTRDTPESRAALSDLISALIGYKITVAAITANEPPVDALGDRSIRFDIACKTEDGRPVNVEMSLNPDRFEPNRLEYYSGKLFTGQDIRGTEFNYKDLKESYQIAILANRLFFADEVYLHTFQYYDAENKIALGGKSRIITVELAKANKVADKPAVQMRDGEKWAVYFQFLTDKSKREKINEILESEEGIAMASSVLINISRDEVEQARLISELKYELDTKSRINTARWEGREEGRQEGRQEGMEKGRAEGLGKTYELVNLIKSGKTPDEAMVLLGLNDSRR